MWPTLASFASFASLINNIDEQWLDVYRVPWSEQMREIKRWKKNTKNKKGMFATKCGLERLDTTFIMLVIIRQVSTRNRCHPRPD